MSQVGGSQRRSLNVHSAGSNHIVAHSFPRDAWGYEERACSAGLPMAQSDVAQLNGFVSRDHRCPVAKHDNAYAGI